MKLGPLEIYWTQRNAALAPRRQDGGRGRSEVATSAVETLPAGLPGTPIFGGFLRDFGEYNSQLEGLAAIRTYEKMRRSDAQVAATLLACELPIRAANWDVLPASDDPLDREIAALRPRQPVWRARVRLAERREDHPVLGRRAAQRPADARLRRRRARGDLRGGRRRGCAWRAWRRACPSPSTAG